ncbi:DUF1295-domain-containing protein [Tilletiaria anomala UBC 951]|uniref:DUF1295-domain-containing protein n=1 Tax=Tilletiaria anomala (strain ATCC 24038 / CBS 436.72 / UBC 951) TaxID=1037660 RepID=A0A066WLE8_TILAU|nr:DUF1295-domain-containing protein [Tilletiaria anomala UBC 951]KDN53398.1 DUF1295-domain-containing protein [Tilletiaria anomala UBC 951]
MAVYVLDKYNLAFTFLISLGWQALGFAIAFGLQIDTITDFWSAVNFFALALITLCLGGQYDGRNIAASTLVMIWAVRLGAWQLFRMLKMGGDKRFDEMRSKPLSLAGFWSLQLLWVWVVSLPAILLNSPATNIPSRGGIHLSFGTDKDIAGVILCGLGVLIEATADLQKYRFKCVTKALKGAIIDLGLWGWSRRPNYFGEILFWWGMYILCLSPAIDQRDSTTSASISHGGRAALIASVFSPLFTMVLLLFISGVPLAEKPTQEKYFLMSHGPDSDDGHNDLEPFGKWQRECDPWARMRAHRERTSLLLPLPPALYWPLPRFVKTWVLLDLPMYRFDEAKDGTKAIQAAERKKRAENNA